MTASRPPLWKLLVFACLMVAAIPWLEAWLYQKERPNFWKGAQVLAIASVLTPILSYFKGRMKP